MQPAQSFSSLSYLFTLNAGAFYALLLLDSRSLMDTLFHTFLAVYYAILTVRELILIANGSRIKLYFFGFYVH
jgi:hypothetical protein